MLADRPSFTARWVATHRARLHATRPTTASSLADIELRLYQGFGPLHALRWLPPTAMSMRTAFIDREVVDALDRGTDQVVIVGAGYDGRSLRFASPGVRWFEVDHPATQPDKMRRLAAAGAPEGAATFVPVDLLSDDLDASLFGAGHDARRPTLFVCEGLFTYLPNAVGAELCTLLRARAAAGSRFTANYLIAGRSRAGLLSVVDRALGALGEHRQGIYHQGDPETMLDGTGWRITRSETSRPNRLAGGTHLLLVGADSAPP